MGVIPKLGHAVIDSAKRTKFQNSSLSAVYSLVKDMQIKDRLRSMVLEIEDLSAGYLVSDNYTFTFWVRTSAQLLMHGINSFVQGAVLKSGFEYDSHVQSARKQETGQKFLTSSEQALQMEPTSVQRHSDVLNCLLTCATPRLWQAWRLSKWELMDEYLDGTDKEGLIKKDQFSVAEKIVLSKRALIALLAIYTAIPLGKRVTSGFTKIGFGASGLGAQVGDCWLQYAKLCRSAGYYETANQAILEAQASAQAIRRSNEEKFRVAVLVSQTALQFIHGLSSDYIAPEKVLQRSSPRQPPMGAQNGLGIVASVLLVVCVTAISDYRQSLQFKDLDTEKKRLQLKLLEVGRGKRYQTKIQDGSCKMLVTTIGMRTKWRSFTPGHVFKCKKTTARRLHLAKELLTFLVEALKSFGETKEGTSEKVLQFCGESVDPTVQTSQFCRNLEKSLSPLFKDAAYRDFDLKLSLNWQEINSLHRLPTEFNKERKPGEKSDAEFNGKSKGIQWLFKMTFMDEFSRELKRIQVVTYVGETQLR
ncbi:Serine/threonine-protein kinase ATR [Vitis vinifera]|uniref:Serine/threonine-protein kinase ATR n=1 Tax=Vitis vinifera TaxID=29760 RepID=A0A438HW02_VITVI|nr:Serine/threonine-protein kinase ATR [Vitis vinifera]